MQNSSRDGAEKIVKIVVHRFQLKRAKLAWGLKYAWNRHGSLSIEQPLT